MNGEILWAPPADVRDRSRIGDYLRWLREERGLDFDDQARRSRSSAEGASDAAGIQARRSRSSAEGASDAADVYAALWQWSVTDLDAFWRSIWDYFDVSAYTPPSETLRGTTMPGAKWFPGATLNYAEHVLRMPGLADDDPVVIAHSQTRPPVTLSAAGLREEVRKVRAGLKRLGVGEGDRVAAYAPNIPETFVLLLATASLGAIFSSCAPEFGTRSVTDRWQQIEPKVLLAVDGYRYGDKPVNRRAEVETIREALPSVVHTVVLSYLDPDAAPLEGTLSWADLAADSDEPLDFAAVPFDHPLYVLYSSGTTGLPKPIVHGHGGILLEHLKMLALHQDLGPGDRFFWFTTTGWMMWNFLVSGPAVGAAIVLFDGNPGHPDLAALWRLAADTGTTYFGTSAPFLLACRKAGLRPKEVADLSALRGLGSTGAPLPAEGFVWVYEAVAVPAHGVAGASGAGPTPTRTRLQLQSLSGGTDVCTGFVGGVPLLPVYAGEITCRCLGARVEAFSGDEGSGAARVGRGGAGVRAEGSGAARVGRGGAGMRAGRPVIGELGELVITAPMPSMPVSFWNDPDGRRYREAYFDVYPGVWRHGDWITISERGTCVITGRSDATLNRGGVRLGTSEFYSVVEGLDEVLDSVVIHLEDAEGGAGELLLFVVLADGLDLDDALRAKIARELRTALSPRHVPDEIHQVRAVPRTLSAKKLEVPVKKILTGTPVDSAAATGALANPESLTAFERFAKQRADR